MLHRSLSNLTHYKLMRGLPTVTVLVNNSKGDAALEEKGEMNRKKESTQTTVMDLNSDCLLKIFRYLEVDQMAIASDTCRRFRDIGCEAFKYEHKSKTIFLSAGNRNSKKAATAILRNFGHQLQRIHIEFCGKWNKHLLEMIIQKCSGEKLTELDASIDIFKLSNIDRFNRKFTNLKCLELKNEHNVTEIDFDLYFPALEQLKLYGKRFCNYHVQKFISRHSQLKCLDISYLDSSDRLKSLLDAVDQLLPHLEQLAIWWMSDDHSELTDYQPKFFKYLKSLKFYVFDSGHFMQCLSISNAKLEELEFQFGRCDSETFDFICQYKEVKKLSIRDNFHPLDYKNLLKLNDHLMKLEEVEITNERCNYNRQAIVRFILGSKQLIKFTIKDFELKDLLRFKKDLQRQLATTEWVIDCNLSISEIKIRKVSAN